MHGPQAYMDAWAPATVAGPIHKTLVSRCPQ